MNPRKRIPATLTAILAILALTACGETPKGDVQGTVNNPAPGQSATPGTAARQIKKPPPCGRGIALSKRQV